MKPHIRLHTNGVLWQAEYALAWTPSYVGACYDTARACVREALINLGLLD